MKNTKIRLIKRKLCDPKGYIAFRMVWREIWVKQEGTLYKHPQPPAEIGPRFEFAFIVYIWSPVLECWTCGKDTNVVIGWPDISQKLTGNLNSALESIIIYRYLSIYIYIYGTRDFLVVIGWPDICQNLRGILTLYLKR